MEPRTIPVKLEIDSEEVREALVPIISSLKDFTLYDGRSGNTPEILILEVGENVEEEFENLQSILNSGFAREVFLTSSNPDPELLVRAMRIGAREFFSQPIQEEEVRLALERYRDRRVPLKEESMNSKGGRIIDVVGVKGGIGSTTIAVNLAVSLAQSKQSHSVALVDMNLLFGEVPLFLDIKPSYHWGEIARNISRLDATFLTSVMDKHASGIHVLSSPSQFDGNHTATPEIMSRLLTLMRMMFDYIVVDSGHATDDVSMKIVEMADDLLLITVLSVPCLSNLNRFVRLLMDMGYYRQDRVKVIVNRFTNDSDISLKDAVQITGQEIFRTIPNDFRASMSAINQGKTLGEIADRSLLTKGIKDLAATLSNAEGEQPQKNGSFLSRLLRRK